MPALAQYRAIPNVHPERLYEMFGAMAGELSTFVREDRTAPSFTHSGALCAEKAQRNPHRHVLSRAVEASRDLELNAIVDELNARDIFLLCSDGLTAVVSEVEIHREMQSGAPDNVTIIVVVRTPSLS